MACLFGLKCSFERIVVVDIPALTNWNAFEIELIVFCPCLDVSTSGTVK